MMKRIDRLSEVSFTYTNYKGETRPRRALVYDICWGSTEYHLEPQFLLTAFDLDKGTLRTFAMNDIKELTFIDKNKNH